MPCPYCLNYCTSHFNSNYRSTVGRVDVTPRRRCIILWRWIKGKCTRLFGRKGRLPSCTSPGTTKHDLGVRNDQGVGPSLTPVTTQSAVYMAIHHEERPVLGVFGQKWTYPSLSKGMGTLLGVAKRTANATRTLLLNADFSLSFLLDLIFT